MLGILELVWCDCEIVSGSDDVERWRRRGLECVK